MTGAGAKRLRVQRELGSMGVETWGWVRAKNDDTDDEKEGCIV